MNRSQSATPDRQALAPGALTLAQAARAVAAVVGGRSADDALLAAATQADRSAVRAIALGTLRWYLRLAPAVTPLLSRGTAEMPAELLALLVCAAHQVEYSRSAPEVSVHLAVDAARALGAPRAAGMVNAVLRRFVRERPQLLAAVDQDIAVRHAHPAWLVEALRAAWPTQLESILEANNQHPPMLLRVAATHAKAAQYLRELAAAGRAGEALEWCPGAVRLEHACSVTALPGFAAGHVSVQDVAAQCAAPLLDAQPGECVLDACAAPGGKTGHILERQPQVANLVAVDWSENRLTQVRDTLRRLQQTARCEQLDLAGDRAAASLLSFNNSRPYDRILLDAPCSATGVIRRHPDIKLLRRATDVPAMAATQAKILDQLLSVLRPGGRLVYATCSLLPEENEQTIQAVLARRPGLRSVPWPAAVQLPPGALRLSHGVQLLPGGAALSDGFYYACLTQ